MVIAEVQIYLANIQVGDWAMGGTLAAHEIGCLVETGYLVESRMLGGEKNNRMLGDGPKGDIARRTMSVCTQQCMAVFWVR